jgi:hypothetical protein
MTPLKKKLCLFESGWLNGGNDGLPWFYDWMRFVAVAGFDYCLNHRVRDLNSDIRIKRETVFPKEISRARIRSIQLSAVLCIWNRPVLG